MKQQARLSEALIEAATALSRFLPGARIAPIARYLNRIQQSYDRTAWQRGVQTRYDPQLLITEQVLREAPRLDGGLVKIDETFTKVLYLYLYPQTLPAWFTQLAPISATDRKSVV